MFSTYNQLLEEHCSEVVASLAAESADRRAGMINSLFTELARETGKESYIQKHLYLKQIILFYRNIVANYFIPLMKDHAMCLAVEEVMNPYATLFSSLPSN